VEIDQQLVEIAAFVESPGGISLMIAIGYERERAAGGNLVHFQHHLNCMSAPRPGRLVATHQFGCNQGEADIRALKILGRVSAWGAHVGSAPDPTDFPGLPAAEHGRAANLQGVCR